MPRWGRRNTSLYAFPRRGFDFFLKAVVFFICRNCQPHVNFMVRKDGRGRRSGTPLEGEGDSDVFYKNKDNYDDAATLRKKIRVILKHDPEALGIFDMLEADIGDVDAATLHRLADEIAHD